MQKLALFAGAVVMALGVSAASSSAFAMGCLDNQNQMVTPSLTDSLDAVKTGSTPATEPVPRRRSAHFGFRES